MKYINAEKLKSVIKTQINERKNWMKDVDKSDRQDQLWSDLNGEDMSILQIINSLQQEQPEVDEQEYGPYARQYPKSKVSQEQPEVDLFKRPEIPIKDAIEVTSRMQHIDNDIKPIAEFILDYASWNLHKDEWNQPVIEVPLFRVLDALVQRGKPYCCAG